MRKKKGRMRETGKLNETGKVDKKKYEDDVEQGRRKEKKEKKNEYWRKRNKRKKTRRRRRNWRGVKRRTTRKWRTRDKMEFKKKRKFEETRLGGGRQRRKEGREGRRCQKGGDSRQCHNLLLRLPGTHLSHTRGQAIKKINGSFICGPDHASRQGTAPPSITTDWILLPPIP